MDKVSSILAVLLVFAGAVGSRTVFADDRTATVERADRVLVVKSERKLYLMKGDRPLRAFDVSLGLAPKGHKSRSGDSRTPEGRYYLDARNTESDFFLSIHVSYPNDHDRQRAAALGVDPGGQIMIHGLPNELKYDEGRYAGSDWTDGCIALANADMIDVWLMTTDMTPIEIRP